MAGCSPDRVSRSQERSEAAPTMPRPELPAFEGQTDWLEAEFAEQLERVRAEFATWPAPEPEEDPVLLEYQRLAAMGLCDLPAFEQSG